MCISDNIFSTTANGSEVVVAFECEVEIRLAGLSQPPSSLLAPCLDRNEKQDWQGRGQGLKSNLDLLLHSYNDSPSLSVCLLLFV